MLFTGLPTRSPRSDRFQGTMYSTFGSSRLPVIWVVSSSMLSCAFPPGAPGLEALPAAVATLAGAAAVEAPFADPLAAGPAATDEPAADSAPVDPALVDDGAP